MEFLQPCSVRWSLHPELYNVLQFLDFTLDLHKGFVIEVQMHNELNALGERKSTI